MDNEKLNARLLLVHALSPISLAFLGDSVYDVKIREHIIETYPSDKIATIHKKAVAFAKASSQANVVHTLMDENFFSEEEINWIKKGRNAHSLAPKNAPPVEYRYATGFETLIGVLSLMEKYERIDEIITRAIRIVKI